MFNYYKNKFIHYIFSGNEHRLHSPFLFDLYNSCIVSPRYLYVFDKIEECKLVKINSTQTILRTDYGTGKSLNYNQAISTIAKHSKPFKISSFLYNLAFYTNAKNILELGTSLGFTTSYLASVDNANVTTIDGDKELMKLAKEYWKQNGFNNITGVTGNLDNCLEDSIKKLDKIDFVFMDSNHTYDATLRYFTTILPYLHENSVVVVDDIYWSEGMTKAWNEIKLNPKVTVSLDFFHLGVLFFRTKQLKESFKLSIN